MKKLYGDMYSCKMSRKRAFSTSKEDSEAINFRHKLKRFKVGVIVYDMEPIKNCLAEIWKKYAEDKLDKSIFKIKKRRGKAK